MDKITCSKRFTDIPFAHRQHNHDGHCAWIHGHNWEFELEFSAKTLDENNFVIDFGKLGFIKQWIKDKLDHSLLLNESDPELDFFLDHLGRTGFARIQVIPDGSAEGLAKYIHEVLNTLVQIETNARVWISKVTVREDSKNFATFIPRDPRR